MKKRIFAILLSVLIIAGLTACSTASKDTVGTTEPTVTTSNEESSMAESPQSTEVNITEKETTTSESTTKKNSNSETTTRPADTKSAGQTTTKKVTTTQKSTTTQRQTTTRNQTATQKVTTTQKQTTTKKVTTTSAPYWCDEGGTHHSCEVGQIGWVNSYEEASDKAYDYLGSHNVTGNFRVKQCHNCGKFTAKITLD